MSSDWDYAVASEALDFISNCSTTNRRRIFTVLRELPENPAIKPDAFFSDPSGRKVSVVWLSGVKISFWVDHFGKEVRVTEISFD